jgi:hypothetical protein
LLGGAAAYSGGQVWVGASHVAARAARHDHSRPGGRRCPDPRHRAGRPVPRPGPPRHGSTSMPNAARTPAAAASASSTGSPGIRPTARIRCWARSASRLFMGCGCCWSAPASGAAESTTSQGRTAELVTRRIASHRRERSPSVGRDGVCGEQ